MANTNSIVTVNPTTGQKLREYPVHSAAEVNRILVNAARGAEGWKREPILRRRDVLKKIADLLRRDQAQLAALMQSEMGKRPEEGKAEVEKCAVAAEYFWEHGLSFLDTMPTVTEANKSYVSFEPLGTVLAIMPWNFPLWQAIRCLVPALLAGNTVILKHASNVTGCSLALEKLVQEACGRQDLFQSVLLRGREALPLIERAEISAVSFTGSTDAGREIAAAAGRALKKSVLELGGSDPYLVLADADVGRAAKVWGATRLINAGPSCIARQSFLVG
jgi:succinate-semialdehyde dehydrogenase/glutarate-semialdehyde dehydrogenase